MIKIEFKDNISKTKSGVSARTGKPYSIREQEGWAYTFDRQGKPHPYPQKCSITLPDEMQDAYPAGVYTLSPASIYLNRFGQLELAPALVPVAAAAKVAA